MKKLTTKAICIFLLFFASCSKEGSNLQDTGDIKKASSNNLISDQVYNRINDYLKERDKIPVNLDRFFPDNQITKDDKEKIVKHIKMQTRLYNDVGINGLLDQLNHNPKVSKKIVGYFDELQGIMRVKEDRKETSFGEIDSTIRTIESKIIADKQLNINDAELLLNSFQVTRGAYKYMVESKDNALKNGQLQVRCGFLVPPGAAVVAGLVVADLIIEGIIKVSAATGQWYIAAAAVATLAITYILCEVLCVFGGCEVPQCDLITGIPTPSVPRTCNSTRVSLYGGRDIVKWQWLVTVGSGTFDNFETTVPFNTFRSSGSSLSTNIKVTSICINEEKREAFKSFIFDDEISGTRPVSIVDGPNSGSKYQSLRFYASQASEDNFSLSWQLSPSGGSVNSSSYWADVTFYLSGTYTLKAKMTNTCTGQVTEATKLITIN
jgi:hypothetical protein